jgi:hypothetical protein
VFLCFLLGLLHRLLHTEYAGSISLSFCGLSYSHDYSRTAIPLRKA